MTASLACGHRYLALRTLHQPRQCNRSSNKSPHNSIKLVAWRNNYPLISARSSPVSSAGYAALNQQFDKVLAIPGAAEVLKPSIDVLQSKLAALSVAS